MRIGHDWSFEDGPQLDEGELHDAWLDLRDDLLAEHIAAQPFTRPHAWWAYDAPEPRRLRPADDIRAEWARGLPGLLALHPEGSERHTFWLSVDPVPEAQPGEELSFGVPRFPVGVMSTGAYESERDYLIRLDLLTDAERALLVT